MSKLNAILAAILDKIAQLEKHVAEGETAHTGTFPRLRMHVQTFRNHCILQLTDHHGLGTTAIGNLFGLTNGQINRIIYNLKNTKAQGIRTRAPIAKTKHCNVVLELLADAGQIAFKAMGATGICEPGFSIKKTNWGEFESISVRIRQLHEANEATLNERILTTQRERQRQRESDKVHVKAFAEKIETTNHPRPDLKNQEVLEILGKLDKGDLSDWFDLDAVTGADGHRFAKFKPVPNWLKSSAVYTNYMFGLFKVNALPGTRNEQRHIVVLYEEITTGDILFRKTIAPGINNVVYEVEHTALIQFKNQFAQRLSEYVSYCKDIRKLKQSVETEEAQTA